MCYQSKVNKQDTPTVVGMRKLISRSMQTKHVGCSKHEGISEGVVTKCMCYNQPIRFD